MAPIAAMDNKQVDQPITGKKQFSAEEVENATIKLYQAIKSYDLEGVKKAITEGADLNIAPEGSLSPLGFFTYETSRNAPVNLDLAKQIIKLLIDNGANIDKADQSGFTPLINAVDCLEIFSYLIECGANVNLNISNGNSPLHIICYFGKITGHPVNNTIVDLIYLLIDAGAKLNTKNNNGQTALHMATQQLSLEVVKCLIENGIDFSIKNNQGIDAQKQALSNASQEIHQCIASSIEQLHQIFVKNPTTPVINDEQKIALLRRAYLGASAEQMSNHSPEKKTNDLTLENLIIDEAEEEMIDMSENGRVFKETEQNSFYLDLVKIHQAYVDSGQVEKLQQLLRACRFDTLSEQEK